MPLKEYFRPNFVFDKKWNIIIKKEFLMMIPYVLAAAAAALGLLAGMLLAARTKSKLTTQIELLRQSRDHIQSASSSQVQRMEEELSQARLLGDQRLQQQRREWEDRLRQLQAEHQQQLALLKQDHHCQMERLEEAHRVTLLEKDQSNQALMDEQDKRFAQTVLSLRQEVHSATEQMLKDRQLEFSQSSNKELEPLRESIREMGKALEQNKQDQGRFSAELKGHMEEMLRQSEAARHSAEELTLAFRHKSKVQGDWGEVVLAELLESQGLQRGVHFHTQATLKDLDGHTIRPDQGANLRPDVIMHLDEGRDVIIDSKVSLTSYINYANASDEVLRRQHLRNHVASLRKHVDELAHKDYSSHTHNPIDFVIMFVPHSMALLAATAEEPTLWREAMEKKVFITDEQTLYAALRIIKLTWTRIEQEQNHQQLYSAASLLLDRVGLFLQRYDAIGLSLHKLQQQFSEAQSLLLDHGKSIPVAAQNLMKLGTKHRTDKNKIPAQYLSQLDSNTDQ